MAYMTNRKKLLTVVICLAVFIILTGGIFAFTGNRQIFDTTYRFEKAILSLPDGTVVSGNVDAWRDYEDGDQIQVKIDGTTYLVHSSNIVLIND